jgi:hypothetical protein
VFANSPRVGSADVAHHRGDESRERLGGLRQFCSALIHQRIRGRRQCLALSFEQQEQLLER